MLTGSGTEPSIHLSILIFAEFARKLHADGFSECFDSCQHAMRAGEFLPTCRPNAELTQGETFAQIDAANFWILAQFLRRAGAKDLSLVDDVGAVGHGKVSRTLWSVIRTPYPLAFRSKIMSCRSCTAMGQFRKRVRPAE